MRSTLRRLAKVKPGQYLEPHTPTGLTGIRTHPSPRPTLIYTYSRTLEKLKTLPESSAYRQSTEALTRHRLKIVEDTKPAGFDTWLERSKQRIAENPELYEFAKQPDGSYKFSSIDQVAGAEPDTAREDPEVEGPYSEEIKGNIAKKIEKDIEENVKPEIEWEAEPPLDAAQISDIENKIGAGLIEEVIMVAEGELGLVDEMAKNNVWEELEEKPAPGQWEYFERGTHTGQTQ